MTTPTLVGPGQEQGVETAYVVHGVENPHEARRRRRSLAVNAGRVLLVVVVLGAWQYFGPKIGKVTASSPTDVYDAFRTWASSGQLARDVEATMEEVVLGYILGAAVGIVLGVVLASAEFVASLIDPFIMALFGIPLIALGPLMVVWFGIGLSPKVILAAVLVFFFVFYSTYEGIRNVDQGLVTAAHLMGASNMQVRRHITMPAARSNIVLGLKLGVPQALVGAIVGEFISSSKGIGYHIQFATSQLQTGGVFAGLVLLAALAMLLNGLVRIGSKNRSASDRMIGGPTR